MIEGVNRRALLSLVLGVWIGGTLFMWTVATQNFALVAQILSDPDDGFARVSEALSADELRLTMRYQASEANRLFFEAWGWAQLPIAALAAGLAWNAGPKPKALRIATAAMLLITAFLSLWVVPETVRLGRVIDFIPRDGSSANEVAFWRLHHTYTGLDSVKLLLALVGGFLAVRAPRTKS
jgi:hypothetical protein